MMTPGDIDKLDKECELEFLEKNTEHLKNKINILEQKITELEEKEKTLISLKEYDRLMDGLKEYKEIKELKPIAEMMERAIDMLTVWV